MKVYRGIWSFQAPKEKETNMSHLISTSLSKGVAKRFAKEKEFMRNRYKYIMAINVPKGTSAAHIEKYKKIRDFGYEDEIVLPPGKFNLKKTTKNPFTKRIYYHGDYEENK